MQNVFGTQRRRRRSIRKYHENNDKRMSIKCDKKGGRRDKQAIKYQ